MANGPDKDDKHKYTVYMVDKQIKLNFNGIKYQQYVKR